MAGAGAIYDSGSSLGYDKMPGQMRSEKDVICSSPSKTTTPSS